MKWLAVVLACAVLACAAEEDLQARSNILQRVPQHTMGSRVHVLNQCHSQKDQKACESTSCLWCSSKSGSSMCFHLSEYPAIPQRVFQCTADKDVLAAAQRLASRHANPSDPCEGLDQTACDAKDECTWCKSAAVPSSCYTRAQAKFLPAAVFKCDKPAPTLPHALNEPAAAARAGSRAAVAAS